MVKATVNLGLSILVEETETILNADPFYRKTFANPDLRQKLFAYVLSHLPDSYTVILDQIPGLYTTTDQIGEIPISPEFLPGSAEQQLCIKALIHQGILSVLREKETWVSRPV